MRVRLHPPRAGPGTHTETVTETQTPTHTHTYTHTHTHTHTHMVDPGQALLGQQQQQEPMLLDTPLPRLSERGVRKRGRGRPGKGSRSSNLLRDKTTGRYLGKVYDSDGGSDNYTWILEMFEESDSHWLLSPPNQDSPPHPTAAPPHPLTEKQSLPAPPGWRTKRKGNSCAFCIGAPTGAGRCTCIMMPPLTHPQPACALCLGAPSGGHTCSLSLSLSRLPTHTHTHTHTPEIDSFCGLFDVQKASTQAQPDFPTQQ